MKDAILNLAVICTAVVGLMFAAFDNADMAGPTNAQSAPHAIPTGKTVVAATQPFAGNILIDFAG